MARLGKPYKPEIFDLMFHLKEPHEDYSKRCAQELSALEGKVISFPVADGQALYVVQSTKPPILRHIPYGDAYQIPYAHIRGLRQSDVQRMLDQRKALNAMFTHKQKEDR